MLKCLYLLIYWTNHYIKQITILLLIYFKCICKMSSSPLGLCHDLLEPRVFADEVPEIIISSLCFITGCTSCPRSVRPPRSWPRPPRPAPGSPGTPAHSLPREDSLDMHEKYLIERKNRFTKTKTHWCNVMIPPCAHPHLVALTGTRVSVHTQRHLPRLFSLPPSQTGIP